MNIHINKKNCLLLTATILGMTPSYGIEFSDTPQNHKFFMQGAHRLLSAHASLKDEPFYKTLQKTNYFLNERMNVCTRYGKMAIGYTTYSLSNVLKGLSTTSKIGSVSSLYSSKVLGVVGMLDSIGKDMSVNAYGLTQLGISILGANHSLNKKLNSTYLSNITYGMKETIGISSVLGGGVTYGAGICTRLLGLTGKVASNVSYHYLAPSLAALAEKLSSAAHECDGVSQSMFKSL